MRFLATVFALFIFLVFTVPAHATTVSRVILDAEASGQITSQQSSAYRSLYHKASQRSKHNKAHKSLVGHMQMLAKANRLRPRLHPLMAQLQVNYDWKSKTPAVGTRKWLAPTGATWQQGPGPVIYQWVAGQGWQFHPLANFGDLAGKSRKNLPKLSGKGAKLEAATARRQAAIDKLKVQADSLKFYSVDRGYTAFEYQFVWNLPAPFVSGMAQGAGLRAFALLSERIKDPSYTVYAAGMLGAFEQKAPNGVVAKNNSHYLLYSTSSMRVGNGFAQAVLGLYDYAKISGDVRAQRLYETGERQLRRELIEYDTSAWSLYSIDGKESDLHYHRLLTEFLEGFCKRLGPEAGYDYCMTAQRFKAYESQPTRISQVRIKRKPGATVSFFVDKRSTVRVKLGSTTKKFTATAGKNTVRFAKSSGRLHITAVSPTGLTTTKGLP